MAKYRDDLPQLSDELFLTDGGLETTLIFHHGLDLPYFAAFDLLRDSEGWDVLRNYFEGYAAIAESGNFGIIFDSPTWRANADWGEKLGYSDDTLADVNRRSIDLLCELRNAHEAGGAPMVISGCMGPRGDGYNPASFMSEDEAEAYHLKQIAAFAETDADIVTALTMTYPEEAIGLARAAKSAGMPVAISFTVETDGKLPTGPSLKDAIGTVDQATNQAPAYYMINCAHPTHFADALAAGEPWLERLRGIRVNASRLSHAELDEAEELDDGDPLELGQQCSDLRRRFGQLSVLGGCCGTDHRHIKAIGDACASAS